MKVLYFIIKQKKFTAIMHSQDTSIKYSIPEVLIKDM